MVAPHVEQVDVGVNGELISKLQVYADACKPTTTRNSESTQEVCA